MTDPTDSTARVLDTLGKGLDAASSALTLTDRLAGIAGRGGPRWHLWRAFRLRIRAVNVEARGGSMAKVKALRTRAALHLELAAQLTGGREGSLAALRRGVEPLA